MTRDDWPKTIGVAAREGKQDLSWPMISLGQRTDQVGRRCVGPHGGGFEAINTAKRTPCEMRMEGRISVQGDNGGRGVKSDWWVQTEF